MMKNFQLIAKGIDTLPLLQALQLRPDLWNKHKWRTTYEGTPHSEVSDIWIRYSDDKATEDLKDISKVQADSGAVWYPAWKDLPQLRPLVFGLMQRVSAYELGRVLITKLPPGGKIIPHTDNVGNYTDTFDGARYHIALQGFPGSMYRVGDETIEMLSGEVWWFNHLVEHEVHNDSPDDRIHLLIDTRNA